MKQITLAIGIILSSSTFGQNYDLSWASQTTSDMHNDNRGMVEFGDFIYVTGRVESTGTLTMTDNASIPFTSNGSDDIFLSKINKNGSIVWTKTMGGTSNEQAVAITVDQTGNPHILGFYSDSIDMNPNAGETNLISAGDRDVFVAKFDTDGNLVWAKSVGGAGVDQGEGITILSNGIAITGRFQGTFDADPSASTAFLTSNGNNDIFIVKLDFNGDHVWSKNIGSNGGDIGWDLATTSNDRIVVTGVFKNTVAFDGANAAAIFTSNGNNDVYVLCLDEAGNHLWSKAFGGISNDIGGFVDTDASGNIYVGGLFSDSIDLDPGIGVVSKISNGLEDAFLIKFDNDGEYIWSSAIGSVEGTDRYKGITIGPEGDIYSVGLFAGTLTAGTATLTSNGLSDCFIEKLSPAGTSI